MGEKRNKNKMDVISSVNNNSKDTNIKIEMPPCREITHSEDKEENVLFIFLSILNEVKMYQYKSEETGDNCFYCVGISQLEPGTKQVLYRLALEGKKLHRIVIVESEEARQNEINGIDADFWDDPEEMTDKIHSAVCFYKQRIKDYIRRNNDKPILIDENTLIKPSEIKQKELPADIEYTEEEIRTLFYDVPVSNGKKSDNTSIQFQENSLEEFMDIIEAIKGNGKKPINLYIDTQGGFRTSTQQMNAILELLKNQNVNIAAKYATDFNKKNATSIIKEVSSQYRAYDLVSAMIEFKSYGRGAGLKEYFKNVNDENTKEIIELINQISGAISLCNMEAFEKALNDMANLKAFIDSGSKKLNTEIRIVFDDIIENYQDLLGKDRNPFEVIKWCVDRKYYQQAITIIESKMPKMLTETGYLYYNCNDKKNFNRKQDNIDNICKRILKKNHQDWTDVENYLFEQWCKSIIGKKNNILNGTLSNTWQENCPKYHCKEVFIVTDKYNEVDYSFDYSKYHEKIKNNHMFIFFAVLSSAIKEVRNNVNHANAKLTEEKIKDALDTYIVIGNKLHLSEKWRENHKNVEKRNTKRYKATIKSISKKGNVLLYVEDYKKKGDCLLDLRQSRIDINDVQKNMINKEISVKVIKEEGTNTFELFL